MIEIDRYTVRNGNDIDIYTKNSDGRCYKQGFYYYSNLGYNRPTSKHRISKDEFDRMRAYADK